jgi:hypothetical protein
MTDKPTAAEACAQYIYDQDVQLIDYSDHIDRGGNPKEHILWSAAEVLGLIETEGFLAEWECYDDKMSAKKRKRGSAWV